MKAFKQSVLNLNTQNLAVKPVVSGRLLRVIGMTLEAVGCKAAVGSLCQIESPQGNMEAQVVGFSEDIIYLMPTERLHGLEPGARVTPLLRQHRVPVGHGLLGRVIDGLGRPIDGKGRLSCQYAQAHRNQGINPMLRKPITQPLDVGVRAINSLITVGQGQRMGLFAGSGIGKSVLLGMMTKGSTADVVVVGLIGERGREVKEFILDILGDEGLVRAVVIAAPADSSPLMRIKACETTLTIAEEFRDQGLNVLLLMDSLTRFAQAQREIALAIGEPPATKGYPPSVFSMIPQLVERAGNGEQAAGSLTAFFTVLVEGDDLHDPIGDAARAILDGHIVLSRALADAGHYPAIDIDKSISRVMPQVTSEDHQIKARQMRSLHSAYQQNQELISIGAYQHGSNPLTDLAIRMQPQINPFLQQGMQQTINFEQSLANLASLLQMVKLNQAPPTQQAMA